MTGTLQTLRPVLFILISLLVISPTKAEVASREKAVTIVVDKAALAGPFVLTAPIQTDSINKFGKKFSFNDVLDELQPHQKSLFKVAEAKNVLHNEQLPVVEGKSTISFLHFTLQDNF